MSLGLDYRYVRARTERAPSKSLTKRSIYARTSLYSIVTFPPSQVTPRFWPKMIRTTRGIGYQGPFLA